MRLRRSIQPAACGRLHRTKRTFGPTWTLAAVLLCTSVGGPRAQAPPLPAPIASDTAGIGSDSVRFVSGDTIEIVARRARLSLDRAVLSRYPYLRYSDVPVRRPVPVSLLMRPRTIELSRFASVIYGADLGAGTASSLGGLGLVTGMWGGKTTGYLMGAGAILGAIWGGTAKSNDSGFRIRAAVDPTDPAESRRRGLSGGRD
jgi:hypothetical protein